jgi:hypothetical protein
MIIPGRKTGRPLWVYLALLYIFVLLAFLFYESEHRQTETVSPQGPLVMQSFMSSPLLKAPDGPKDSWSKNGNF